MEEHPYQLLIGKLIFFNNRLSTIVNSDVIFHMEKGRITEYGTHEELLKLKKNYFNLVKSASK